MTGYTSFLAQNVLKGIKPGPIVKPGDALSPAPSGAPYGIHFRTLGDVAYFMTSLNTAEEVVRDVEDRIWSVLATN